ncbi:transcriptional regulator prz1 [Camponotus floridanus]|nr:transcriptional regulator prz1 [Camponotus floridanus]
MEIENFCNDWDHISLEPVLFFWDSDYQDLETSFEDLYNRQHIAARSQNYQNNLERLEFESTSSKHISKWIKNALEELRLTISKTRREPTACESLATIVESIPSTSSFSNDLSFLSSTKIRRNKQAAKKKNNAQSFTPEIPERSHLSTSSCEQIKIPSSLQQSTTCTISERKYTTATPINEDCRTVNIKNPVAGGATVAENTNQQLYQTNAPFTNNISEFYNLYPQQEQIYHSNRPSTVPPQEIDKIEDYALEYTWENIILNNYKLEIPIRPVSEQIQVEQQLEELSLTKAGGEVAIAENCNKQLYQANVFSTNSWVSEFHNLPPHQEQFCYSDEPSTITYEKIGNLVEEHALPGCSRENINLNIYESPVNPVPSNSFQQQQLQESFGLEEPNYSQYPHCVPTSSRGEEFVTDTRTYSASNWASQDIFKPPPPYPEKSIKRNSAPLTEALPNPPYTNISPTSNIVSEMKYETQSGPPTTPSHLTSSGVEPPHSSQTSGIVMGDSPAEVVDSLLLSPWAANGPEFLEGGVPDVKQTGGFQDTSWVDSLMLGSTVNVASAQSLMEIKGPLPAFTNYTGHLSINGISGHHYHTIASSGQRSSVPSASPTPSSNQEYYESPVVSSSTPCPQVSQKHQPQNHQQQQQQQQHPHPQSQHQQQQQLPQSTQQIEYDIDDIAEIIGSAIADTTVPGKGNGPSSEQTSDTSGDWIDIAEWIMPECSPKTQETTSPNSFAPQIYVTTTPTISTQQHSSTLQNLLTQTTLQTYVTDLRSPLLQARLQQHSNTAPGLQNASCGETPSSTSPYPPLSPPNRVSTSCSPDDLLHSSFATPSHPRKRSRSSGSGQNTSKKNPAVNAAVLPYGAESEVVGNPKKPVHRCHICSRAFLNKSNIKVHLRTHTGEKPFKCDVCSKAFRQKAHLIKHQQIHKRGGRE